MEVSGTCSGDRIIAPNRNAENMKQMLGVGWT